MSKTRLVAFSDGTGMGNFVYIFKTNAPENELNKLELFSNDVYLQGSDEEDVPIWKEVLEEKGYLFEYIDECQHVTAYGTSREWLNEKYPYITEQYQIENRPVAIRYTEK